MKVKNLINWNGLEYWKTYNVFWILDWNKDDRKIYISTNDVSWRFYISPFDSEEFEVVDSKISKFWEYWINKFWQISIWIPEMFNIDNFWEKYYDDDIEIINILNFYYKIWKNDLFN